eukprot:11370719-Alexandrium_andersonii.AAC.1
MPPWSRRLCSLVPGASRRLRRAGGRSGPSVCWAGSPSWPSRPSGPCGAAACCRASSGGCGGPSRGSP